MDEIRCPAKPNPKYIKEWRDKEKERRKYICQSCGCGGATDLHECIVTRNDVMGLPRDKKAKIFCECNMVLLCRACHEEQHALKDMRAFWWDWMGKLYGYEEMVSWYNSFEWKVPDRRFMGNDLG